MKSFIEKVKEAIRARDTLIFAETAEEEETLKELSRAAFGLGLSTVKWNPIDHFTDISPENGRKAVRPMGETEDLTKMLLEVKENAGDTLFVLQDTQYFLDAQRTDSGLLAGLVRSIKSMKQSLRPTKKTLCFIGTQYNLPPELRDDFTIISYDRPDKDGIKQVLIDFVAQQHCENLLSDNPNIRDEMCEAARGLTAEQTRSALMRTLTVNGKLDGSAVSYILEQKKQIISRNGILEYFEANVTEESVGGLDNLKTWLRKRKKLFSAEARDRALPEPKGILVFGVPGGGKSLTAKAVSAMWEMPLLRFDIGRVFGQYVGQTEQQMREALTVAESVAPCIMWIDEMEKAFAGASGGHETTVRVLGSFLTWMQDKKKPVFVIATANDISGLPSEFLRKGRFDEMFFVSTPNSSEREAILKIQFRKYKLDPARFDLALLVRETDKLTGAEIEQAIIEANTNAFNENNRMVTTEDIQKAYSDITPIWPSFKAKTETAEYKQILKMAKKASPEEGR